MLFEDTVHGPVLFQG